METGSYKDTPRQKVVRFLLLLLVVAFSLRGAFYLAIGLATLTDLAQYGVIPIMNSVIYFGVLGFFLPVFFMLMRDFYCHVIVDETGLHSKRFSRSLHVLWSDIIGIRPMRLFGVIRLQNKYVVETKGSLSALNVLYGILFGGTKHPLLPVDVAINESPKLREKISKQAKKNRKAESKDGETVH
ncbi:MAG: hypothetical protein QM730_11535 [Anaerolineales bacterium]